VSLRIIPLMRVWPTAMVCLLAPLQAGCLIIPLPNKVTAGYKNSPEALEFLKLPGTMRKETIASLGEP
jgi:hypothetical protein